MYGAVTCSAKGIYAPGLGNIAETIEVPVAVNYYSKRPAKAVNKENLPEDNKQRYYREISELMQSTKTAGAEYQEYDELLPLKTWSRLIPRQSELGWTYRRNTGKYSHQQKSNKNFRVRRIHRAERQIRKQETKQYMSAINAAIN